METRCLTQGQMLEAELDLMEFTDGQYSHLQRVIPANMEAGTGPDVSLMSRCWPDVRDHPAAVMVTDVTGPTVTSPLATTQAIDLSVAPEDHSLVKPGEKTPSSFVEVPGFVLAGLRGEKSPTKVPVNSRASSQVTGQRFSARVCLEKRFNTMSVDFQRQRDVQSAAVCHFVKIFQQPGNAQNTLCPHMQTWMKTEGASLLGVSSPANAGGVFNPVSTMCAQVVDNFPHMDELNKHQDDVVTPAVSRKWGHSTRQRARPGMSLIQSRERHNSIERERRKMIRLYCDELNMLVPFCQSGTDRVTTLQWTTAFLVYINKMYGDTFKKEFQNHSMTRKNCV
ncbi:uncharacterized protein LOC118110794 [Hippoglossus stenolepis]|uniref:uncharacterized protein LOC118110794 n=1 Tax=Hippoglossus stenolepis TaxID=195615 RepID=UPI00159CC04C|nr:uncharacterized protein LOC118110794 [Hippoglossus stenolepis]XP_035014753.1 uncharacterized protein LOC118110794 [Hippoglossus stenolepis]